MGSAAVLVAAALVALILLLRWVPPPMTMFMLLEKLKALRENLPDKTIHYEWAPYTTIPAHVALAFMAAEDQTFPEHWGFDVASVKKALEDHERGKPLRGASTISQQTAKNLFLWPGRSFVRKALEAFVTVLLETLWSKRRILEVYVNTAQMGNRVFGVGAAARIFFNTTPGRLTKRQAALLAAVLPNPRRFSPAKPTPYVEKRAAWILRQMELLGGASFLESFWHAGKAHGRQHTAPAFSCVPASAFVLEPPLPVLFPEPRGAPSVL
ncbi:MAG: monofunctional biosynthetic peptidoglycan transglycosylase [Desulfosoma sp.]